MKHGNTNHRQGTDDDTHTERRRRYSTKDGSDWYKAIEAAHIQRIEEEWQLKQAVEEYYEECDGDLVPGTAPRRG